MVAIAADAYERQRLEHLKAPTFVDHLLALPTDDETFERMGGRLREPPF